ncbi:hypothetical protein SprV_0501912500 [Sparganum proliferum]
MARELARYKVDIAALSETRFSEQGQLEEVGAGYIFFWSGRPGAERRDTGVAFAIRNDIVGQLPWRQRSPNEPTSASPAERQIRHHHQCLRSADDQPRRRKRQVLRGPARPPGDCVEGGQVGCPCNELAQPLENHPIADAAAAEDSSVENRWCQLRGTVQSTALAVLGRARRQHQDWLDDNDAVISNLLAEKNHLHKACVDHPTDDNRAALYPSRRHLQQRLRKMQDAWTARKAEEIQGADGSTLLTEKTQILQRWAEHFRGVLNRPSTISDAAIDRLPQVETNVDLNLPSSLQETIRAVQ